MLRETVGCLLLTFLVKYPRASIRFGHALYYRSGTVNVIWTALDSIRQSSFGNFEKRRFVEPLNSPKLPNLQFRFRELIFHEASALRAP